jgi:hypothetical protein
MIHAQRIADENAVLRKNLTLATEARVRAEVAAFEKTLDDLPPSTRTELVALYRCAKTGVLSVTVEKPGVTKDTPEGERERFETLTAPIPPDAARILALMTERLALSIPAFAPVERISWRRHHA